jgi:hypothetical protein
MKFSHECGLEQAKLSYSIVPPDSCYCNYEFEAKHMNLKPMAKVLTTDGLPPVPNQ